jgi:hypothetical protein
MSLALALVLACSLSCGSEDRKETVPPDEEEDAGDGKVRPAPNGQHVGEATACDALLGAQDSKIKSLQCSITTRTCPALLRVVFATKCLEYDDGSVQGCIAHYKKETTCDGLENAINECEVTAYPGTEPKGCP